jgi:branched-chain amino acid transport system ATP-binding protein
MQPSDMATARPLLSVEAVVTGYGSLEVIHGASIHVGGGERVGLFGPNGHGKTTLLRAISALIPVWAGRIRFNGVDITGANPTRIVELGLVHVPQSSTLFPRMTVNENLALGAYSRRGRERRAEALARVHQLFPRLREQRRQLARTLSGGERQMVSIGMGLMANPELLMLDEPTLGLAPNIRSELAATVIAIAEGGVSLVVVDQDIEFLLRVTDRLYLLEQGRIALEADDGEALDRAKVLDSYFGRVPA